MNGTDDNKIIFNIDSQDQQLDISDYKRILLERKKLEDAKRKEERFLRRSLRHSDKLRSLALAHRIAKDINKNLKAEDNLAFEDDGFHGYRKTAGSLTLNVTTFISELRRSLKRYKTVKESSSDIDDDLSDNEWEWLTRTISKKSVLQAFNLHDVIARALETCRLQNKGIDKELWAGPDEATKTFAEVYQQLKTITSPDSNSTELMKIFLKPKFRNLLSAFDGVACVWRHEAEKNEQKMSTTSSPSPHHTPADYDDEEQQGLSQPTAYMSPVEGCYKILAVDDQGNTVTTADGTALVNVMLLKDSTEYLGATVRTEGSAVLIGRIIAGGLIERSGLLNENDELLSVNGIDVTGKDIDHVSYILRSLEGQIQMLIAPSLPITDSFLYQEAALAHLRALYSYEPLNDVYNPCAEASLMFDKGDILRILSTRDPHWWQALRIDDVGVKGVSNSLAGLIPSPLFQRTRSLERLKLKQKSSGAMLENGDDPDYESDASDIETEADLTGSMLSSSLSGIYITDAAKGTYGARMLSSKTTNDASTLNTDDNPPKRVNFSASDTMWSLHGYGPKQIRRQRHGKSKASKLRFILSGHGNRKNSPKHSNDYMLPMYDDQIKMMDEEARTGAVRRPSLLTYEPVELFYPQALRRRPLVLVGPVHVGRQQLIEGLIRDDPNRFDVPAIQTTNEEMKSTALQKYEILSKAEFQQLQASKALVEWGVFNHHYYGTKISSVENMVREGKVCLLALRPDSIRAIRRTPFLPCVIFVSPPSKLEDLRKLRANLGETFTCSNEELKSCIDQSQRMEQHYGHFFEFVLVPDTLDSALQQLKAIAVNLERKPQWVPAHWIQMAVQMAAKAAAERASQGAGTADVINTDSSI